MHFELKYCLLSNFLRWLDNSFKSWDLSLVVRKKILWAVYKLYLCIFYPHRLDKGSWMVYGWVLILFYMIFFLVKYNLLQVNLQRLPKILLIVNLCFCIDLISIFLSWNLSLGVRANFLQAGSKPGIWIWYPCRLDVGCVNGGGCVCFL